jgi:ABC-type branched-subunit amino acid transport system substrate-binding protein
MDEFAIFAPDSSYGQRAADAFTAEATARGLKVVDRANYAEKGTVLTGAAAGLARPGAIDFDAIFVPDAASHLPVVCSALAYVDLPIGAYTALREGHVPLLGLSAWHADSLPSAGGQYTRGALITDGWAPPAVDDAQPGPRAFVARFRAAHDRAPSALEALVSDAGRLVAAATKQGPTTREAFRTAILSASIADSATGTRGFDIETRDAVSGVRILSVGASTFTPLATVDPRPAAVTSP